MEGTAFHPGGGRHLLPASPLATNMVKDSEPITRDPHGQEGQARGRTSDRWRGAASRSRAFPPLERIAIFHGDAAPGLRPRPMTGTWGMKVIAFYPAGRDTILARHFFHLK